MPLPRRTVCGTMLHVSRYRYHQDWEVSYITDCNFGVSCRTLRDALWIAAMKGDNSMIKVHADCEHEGIKGTAHVWIDVREARGRTIDQIFELLDAKVDQYIACRAAVGQWGASPVGKVE
jgi:hypothetical protein